MNLTRIRAGAFVLGLILPSLAFGQATPVYQSGTATPHNLAKITRNGQVQDASPRGVLGDNNGRGANPFAVLDNLGLGICSNSAVTTGPYSQVCLGHDTSGNGVLSLNSYGGQADGSLVVSVNGVALPILPGTVNGTPFVADNATLAGLASTFSATVRRIDHTAGFGAPPLDFTAQTGNCAANSMANDGGSCVNASNGNSWKARHVGMPDIRQWGCSPNDSTDIVPCLAAAYAAKLGPIYIPPGVWRVSSATTFSGNSPDFIGAGWGEFNQNAACPTTGNVQGTWLHRVGSSSGITPFTISGSTPEGSGGWKKMAFCEDHPTPGGGWAPTAYGPWFTINNVGGELSFEDDYLFAIYQFIAYQGSLGSPNGRLGLKHIRGQVFSVNGGFLAADASLDVIHGNDIHLWPYWSNNANVLLWQDANAKAIVTKRVDGIVISDLFINSFQTGVELGSSVNGVTLFASFPSYYCDVCKYALHVTGNNTVAHIPAAYFSGGNLAGSTGILLDGGVTGAQIMVGSYDCASMGGSCARISTVSGSNTLTIQAAWFHGYNQDNGGFTSIAAATDNFVHMPNRPTIGGSNNGGLIVDQVAGGFYEIPIQLPWTPGLAGSTTAGSPTYTTQNGWYMMKGNEITASFQLVGATWPGSPAGNALITGLPYTSSTFAVNPGKCFFTSYSGITFDATYSSASAEVASASTTAVVFENGTGPSAVLTPAKLGTTAVLSGTCIYRIQ